MKRRWDDDVIFKNQARGTDDKNKKKEFVNDLLRSDFHKRFMVNLIPPRLRSGTYTNTDLCRTNTCDRWVFGFPFLPFSFL